MDGKNLEVKLIVDLTKLLNVKINEKNYKDYLRGV